MNFRCKLPPVFAGVLIGVSIILSFVVAGRGIGASGALTRIVAFVQNAIIPDITQGSEYFARYFANGQNPLDNWLLYLLVGLLLGSFVAALVCGDFKFRGGMLVGFAARLARGCTSGMALVGGSELAVGAWVFMLCVFAGGFSAAFFVRKQWI
jgi:hypothetical protein